MEREEVKEYLVGIVIMVVGLPLGIIAVAGFFKLLSEVVKFSADVFFDVKL